MRILIAFLLMIWTFAGTSQALQSPDQFLPQDYGRDFIPYHLKVDYFEYVAGQSELVKLDRYGFSVEKRPLIQAFISTRENLNRLEEIRTNNLHRTGLLQGPVIDDGIAIIMLGYSVHGNEAAGSEAALTTLYELVNPANAQTKEWLKNTLVIIDLSLNPDGHARYVDWYNRVANKITDISLAGWEHQEPWPGGRTNHYFFDLNRDWAWQTQTETKARIKQYLRWMPHIHVDLHEMGVNSPYYFAPAAPPYHEYINAWQREFQTVIGQNNARYFDQRGWLYFTKEVFDLLYPAYGDTYPTYSGAIGMTYEQGGSGRAGSAIILDNGDTLTLQDRIDHHVITSLSSIEVASKFAGELTKRFTDYYKSTANEGKGVYQTYVISQSNNREKIKRLIQLLDLNEIRYATVSQPIEVSGYHYVSGQIRSTTVYPGDLVVSAAQPRSTLTQVLFDPETKLEDSLTYDITSWSLPHVYGLEATATTIHLRNVTAGYRTPEREVELVQDPYAFFIPWQFHTSARLVSKILQEGIKARVLTETMINYGRSYPPGTLVISRADNQNQGDFQKKIIDLAAAADHALFSTTTGLSSSGPDLGSNKLDLLVVPKILLMGDEGVHSTDFGATWHYFEQVLEYPVTIVRVNDFSSVNLNDYNTLVMASGNYTSLNSETIKSISEWVSAGGKLILSGEALNKFRDMPEFALSEFASEEEKKKAADLKKEKEQMNQIFGERIRHSISDEVPGAIVKNRIDTSHPLAYGFPDYYFSLKTEKKIYQRQKDAWNVSLVEKDPLVLGFAGKQVKDKLESSVSYWVQDKGKGNVVYLADDPLFRGFWENGKFLFSNAVFMVGN